MHAEEGRGRAVMEVALKKASWPFLVVQGRGQTRGLRRAQGGFLPKEEAEMEKVGHASWDPF